jgi:hypothetical protein
MIGDKTVHEVQELDTPAAPVMTSFNQPGGNAQRGKQRRRAVAFVGVAEVY